MSIDFTSVKAITIPEGSVKKIMRGSELLWAAKTFTNQVPISTDTDGSIYNEVGYKENVRLSSSGSISGSAQNGSVTTGFIPWHGDGDVLRIKGVEWLNASANYGGHYYIIFYNESKKIMGSSLYLYSGATDQYNHIVTITRNESGVETFIWNKDYGTSNFLLNAVRNASYVRINAYGKGENMIVTINEEIT